MPPTTAERTGLNAIADAVEQTGTDGTPLRTLALELVALDRPPGWWQRMSQATAHTAKLHWQRLVQELQESREAMQLVNDAMRGKTLSDDEREKVRAQVLDLVRLVPASCIAAVNAAIPVPGAMLLTPWLLARLGLMPSKWREAYVLEQLQAECKRLRAAGHEQAARRVTAIYDGLLARTKTRERAHAAGRLLAQWDTNANGTLDSDERAAYLDELARIHALAHTRRARKAWFLELEGQVYGAMRLTHIERELAQQGEFGYLVCYDGKTGWVALTHVLEKNEPTFEISKTG